MITEELKLKISVDTSELKKSVNEAKKTLTTITDSNNGTGKSTKGASAEVDKLKSSIDGLSKVTGIAILGKSFSGLKKIVSSTVSTAKLAASEIIGAFNFKNFDVGDDGLKGYLQSMKIQFQEAGKTISGALVPALKVARNAILGMGAVITGLIAAFNGFTSASKEFREAMNQINTSFISMGSSSEAAQQAFNGFYRVLGEVDRSAEAANLLGQITTSQKELAQWTTIATGALAMFPDSLPTESLIEASNETIKTAKVTGTLADALNWPANGANKISEALKGSTEAQKIFNKAIANGLTVEDAMNEVLAATNNETQREIILRASLNGIYASSAALYEEINRDIIAQNEAQNRLNQAMARVGRITQPLTTAFTNLKATLVNALAPAIQVICGWLVKLVNFLSTAIAWIGAFISVIFPGAAAALKISSAVDGVSDSLASASTGAGGVADNLDKATDSANKLRRTLMGFDELNVVTDPSSGGGGGSSGGSGGGGASGGGGLDVSGIDPGDSVFKKAKDQMEEFKEKIKAFMDEWGTQIKIIAGALGTLGIAGLLKHLGQAIGLGDKFLGVMSSIKKLAVSAIVITLQYTLVNEFMDKFINGDGIKNYILGLLTSAIGTGILYSMWGPAGLVIGLGVTAVASLKAVFDNGGITNVQSAVVALTGVASGIGAIVAGVKLLGPAIAASNFGAFVALLKEGHGLIPTLAAAFPKLAGVVSGLGAAFGSVGSAVTGALGAIGGLVGGGVAAGLAIVAAAVAAVVSVVIFLKENWEAVTAAVKDFFNINIAPKLDAIKESFGKIKDALVGIGKVIWNAIPQSWKDFLGKVADAIGKVVSKIAEWFKSMDWLKAIGKVFETLGGIIVGVVGGAIAGALSTLTTLIEGIVGAISGFAEIVSGVFEAIIGIITLDGEKIIAGGKKIVDGVVDVFKGLWTATVGAVVEFVHGVIDWFTSLWDELVGHSIVPDMIDDIVKCFASLPGKVIEIIKNFITNLISKFTELKDKVVAKVTELKDKAVAKFEEIKSNVNNKIESLKTAVVTKFESIKTSVTQKVESLKQSITTKWENIKTTITTKVDAIKQTVTTKFDNIKTAITDKVESAKQAVTTKFESIRNTVSDKMTSVKNKVGDALSAVKNYFSDKLSNAYDTVSNKLERIRDKFDDIMDSAKNIVSNAIDRIKSFFDFEWSLPKLKMPHFSIRGKFSLDPPSIPHFSVSWYAKGGIFNSPTLFSYGNGRLGGLGENGAEAVLPLENNTGWMDKLADKVAARNQGPSKIVLKVGEREIGWAAINGINNVTKQTGGLQLQLV